ncbi:SDR family NAD(P)-dependent oxidoreductase, partial [Escherichia coli]|uniref:SDR family NAD(P)-dependent oxidoreductase n=1 Tax=Escherichia coli TaxID=562 RepID=UPI00278BF251
MAEAADLEKLVALAQDRFGRIDAVVNNTGHPPTGDILSLTDDQWHAGLDMIVLNVIRVARLVTPVMLAGGQGGAFVNISTIGVRQPDPRF